MTTDSKVYYGTVCWFDSKKGYGFISWSIDGVAQRDLFTHFSDVACEGFKTLTKDQKVSFELGLNKNNAPKAINVKAA